jgi:mono/diheme cytochrome c family protein
MLLHRKRLMIKSALATLAVAGLTAGVAGVAVLFGGWYNISATAQHFPLVYSILNTGLDYSVAHHARAVQAPALGTPAQLRRGAAIYGAHCAQCHGGPGVAPAPIGKSMQPVPGPLVKAAEHWRTRELYWITRHGIKMSGMPAWEYHLSDDDIWATVAFVEVLPRLTPQAYQEAVTPGGAP